MTMSMIGSTVRERMVRVSFIQQNAPETLPGQALVGQESGPSALFRCVYEVCAVVGVAGTAQQQVNGFVDQRRDGVDERLWVWKW